MKVSKQEAERKRGEYEQRRRRETGNSSYSCSTSNWLLLHSATIDNDSSYSSSGHSNSCDDSYSESSSYDYNSSDSSCSSSFD